MHFHVRKRRGTPAVIIVALIDVLIVMLIFLMATMTFKQQPALKLSLPESSQATREGASETAALVISIDSKGVIRFGTDALPVTEDRLKQEIQKAVAKNPDQRFALSSDKDAPVGQFIKVMDAAKAANVKMLSAFAKEAK